MKNRLDSRGAREEKLNKLLLELSEKREAFKLHKLDVENKLAKAIDRFQCLASNRQIYREVEEKDAALNAARKGAKNSTRFLYLYSFLNILCFLIP